MKIIILQENFREALVACSKAVATTSSLPILNSFLLKTENGQLLVNATNLEMSVANTIRCKVEEDGEVCVQARALLELVGNLPNEPVTVSLEGNYLCLKSNSFDTKLNTYDSADFPKTSFDKVVVNYKVKAKELSKGLSGAIFAVSNNETQAEICGVYVGLSTENIFFVGTDRYRLGEKSTKVELLEQVATKGVIIPPKAATEIVRFCESLGDGFATMSFEEGRVVVGLGNTTVSSRLIDGNYPDYKAIIPSSFETNVTIDRRVFGTALKTVGVFAKSGEGFGFVIDKDRNKVVLSASASDSGSGRVEVDALISGGDDEKVLFSYKYLHDVVSYLVDDEIVVRLNNSQSPVVIQGSKNKDYLYLVMPIKK